MLLKILTPFLISNLLVISFSAANEQQHLLPITKAGYGSTQNQLPPHVNLIDLQETKRGNADVNKVMQQCTDIKRTEVQKHLTEKALQTSDQLKAKRMSIEKIDQELNRFNKNKVYSPTLASLAQAKRKSEEDLKSINHSYERFKVYLPTQTQDQGSSK